MKKVDIALLVLFPIVSTVISLVFSVNFFVSILLFFGLPSLWLSVRNPGKIKNTIIFSLILSLSFGLIIDYVAINDLSWFVPNTIFPFRLFGLVPLEDLIWGFFLSYGAVIFYENFTARGKQQQGSNKMKYLTGISIAFVAIFLLLERLNPAILVIQYAYFWVGFVFFIVPTVVFLKIFPNKFKKFTKTAIYFFVVAILFEYTGLQLRQWVFPGVHYIGMVDTFGVKFPFEELLFWFILGPISILSVYVFFGNPNLYDK